MSQENIRQQITETKAQIDAAEERGDDNSLALAAALRLTLDQLLTDAAKQ